jgi:hypothetical protein
VTDAAVGGWLGLFSIRIEKVGDQHSTKLHPRRIAGVDFNIRQIEIVELGPAKIDVGECRSRQIDVIETRFVQIHVIKFGARKISLRGMQDFFSVSDVHWDKNFRLDVNDLRLSARPVRVQRAF